jgi:uridine phosphorylase
VGKYILLPGDPARTKLIAQFLKKAKLVASQREFTTYTGYLEGIKVSTTSTGIGCPSAAICLEELAEVGGEVFIRVGTAGSLQPEVKIGDLVISQASIREEGTSRQYIPLSYPAVADFEVTLALKKAAEKLKYPYHLGITHCKDAFYTEKVKSLPLEESQQILWKVWQRGGALATSMESGALFVLAKIRRLKAGEVLAIVGLTWKKRPFLEKRGIEEAIKVALEAIKILEKK